jgi:hypothetical protein
MAAPPPIILTILQRQIKIWRGKENGVQIEAEKDTTEGIHNTEFTASVV